jgi:hypothetical protein
MQAERQALIAAKYAIKTGWGSLKEHSSTIDQPTHGPGKGSRQHPLCGW